ncbi:MAG: LytTR family transcriptional regulator DNA-binding domain-containing protein [Lewinellaceae bacterium]|nr:LytTR family transcriptional regulator DNA-binding domain-containing protein [Saprospiraceae bacterium]MCB9331758.1 LytTR family transcriptional regulator DNA-binding domain-containing protein [Lewinellaceae bacterium]
MIRIGCVCAHSDDASILASEPVRQWANRSCPWVLDHMPEPIDTTAVDILLLPVDILSKKPIRNLLPVKPWVMVSPRKIDAFKAWQLGAAYFLLRPYSVPDLKRALERAEQLFYWNRGLIPPQFQSPVINLQLTKGRRLSVPVRNVLFLEAEGEVTQVYSDLPGQERVTAIRNLGYWEQALGDPRFVRVHKKYLVNMSQVSDLDTGQLQVRHFCLPVAKRRQKEVETQFFQWRNPGVGPVNTVLNG